MRTLIILLLLAAPASAAWDLDNLTPSQRASLITMRDRWNAGFRGTPRCNTGSCSWGLDWSSWTRRQPAATGGNRRQPARTWSSSSYYTGGPETVLNPFVSEAEGGSGQ